MLRHQRTIRQAEAGIVQVQEAKARLRRGILGIAEHDAAQIASRTPKSSDRTKAHAEGTNEAKHAAEAAEAAAGGNTEQEGRRRPEKELMEERRQRAEEEERYLFCTPRESHERHKTWSVLHRQELRRTLRERAFSDMDAEEQALRDKVAAATRRLHRTGRLPALHLESLRRPGVASEQFQDLLQRNPNVRGPNGWQALHLAVIHGHEGLVAVVAQAPGCDVDAADCAGYTALHYAMSRAVVSESESGAASVSTEGFGMAKTLVNAGADLTRRNREGLNAVQVALAVGLYDPVARFLEQFSVWALACMHARRFFLDYFAGEPAVHHYKGPAYEQDVLMAFVVVAHPRKLQGRLQLALRLRSKRGRARTMNNLERFFHDVDGDCLYDARYNDRFNSTTVARKRRTGVRRRAVKMLRRRFLFEDDDVPPKPATGGLGPASASASAGAAGTAGSRGLRGGPGSGSPLTKVRSVGLFREFPEDKVSEWLAKAKKWNFNKGAALAEAIAERAFEGRLSGAEVSARMVEGREHFEQWKASNLLVLQEDEKRRLREVADAVRQRKTLEDRRARAEEIQMAEEQLQLERKKKGLDRLDPDACVQVSESVLYYSVDQGVGLEYCVELGSRPTAPVLVKFAVKPREAGEEGAVVDAITQFKCRPTLTTFTPANWDEPQWVTVEPVDDDAIVRMKRTISQGARGACDHNVVHSIQSTTDWSYKHPTLKWEPTKDLRILVK